MHRIFVVLFFIIFPAASSVSAEIFLCNLDDGTSGVIYKIDPSWAITETEYLQVLKDTDISGKPTIHFTTTTTIDRRSGQFSMVQVGTSEGLPPQTTTTTGKCTDVTNLQHKS
jgi:hypothetical protein